MTMTMVVHAPVSAEGRARVEEAWRRYHASVTEHGPADEWDNRVIRRVILTLAREGRPFSANDMRPLLPEVRKCLISRRLIDAMNDGWIRRVGVTYSDLASTKGARVSMYAPIRGGLPR